MTIPAKRMAALAVLCLWLSSCGERTPDRKETFPVTGEVYVDGQPAAQLQIACHDVKGIDAAVPTVSSAMTGPDGKFAISTYQSADGVPEGEYLLTFTWGTFNMITKSYGGPDKLNGRYADQQKSPHRFKVEPGKPTELGRIELSTK